MEARDSRSKIRPLPIDEIDGDVPPPHRVDAPRRWLPLVVIGLAMFAVPEIIDLLRGGGAISRSASLGSGWMRGLKDMWAYKWICTRCAGIG